jgi:hypothetical protein
MPPAYLRPTGQREPRIQLPTNRPPSLVDALGLKAFALFKEKKKAPNARIFYFR